MTCENTSVIRDLNSSGTSQVGLALVLFGLGAWIVALVRWAEADYGELTTNDMRVPILGMVTIVAGLQTALVSFTLSLTRIGEP